VGLSADLATLGVACVTAAVLLAIPVIWGWRSIFAKTPGKALSVVYFACLAPATSWSKSA